MVGSWVVGGWVLLLCTVVLHCCTTYRRTAGVQGGWVDRFGGESMGSGVILFYFVYFPRYAGPAGTVLRTTSIW